MRNVEVDPSKHRDGMCHVLGYTPRKACAVVKYANIHGEDIYYFGDTHVDDAYMKIVVDCGSQGSAELFAKHLDNLKSV